MKTPIYEQKETTEARNTPGRRILTIPGWCDRDVEDGVVGVPLHEAPDAQHVAGEGQAAPRPAAPERRVGAIVHLVKPVRRVRELALNSSRCQQTCKRCLKMFEDAYQHHST